MSKLDAASTLGKPVHRDVEQPGQLLASLDVRLADVQNAEIFDQVYGCFWPEATVD